MHFNGSAYVGFNSQTNLILTSAVTVEAWIYPTSFGFAPSQGTIFCKHSWSSGPEQGYVLRAGGQGEVEFNLAGVDTDGVNVSWQFATTPINTIQLNEWNHVAGTFDGHVICVYVNGILSASTIFEGTIEASNAYPAAIGALSDLGQFMSRYWNGEIDELRVWDRALSSSELVSNMNSHIDPSTQTGLVGYYRFNELTGTTVNDLSTSANIGTANSASFNVNVPWSQSAAVPTLFPSGNTLTSSPAVTYQWNVNNTPIPNAVTQQWTATQNGSYTVTITDSIGCQATSLPYIITGVGLMEIDGNTVTVVIADHTANISTDAKILTEIRLSDVQGKTVSVHRINHDNEASVDLNGLQSGVYMLIVNSDKGSSVQRIYIP